MIRDAGLEPDNGQLQLLQCTDLKSINAGRVFTQRQNTIDHILSCVRGAHTYMVDVWAAHCLYKLTRVGWCWLAARFVAH